MVFTAYFDESGTHAGAESSAMAGFVGDAGTWGVSRPELRTD
jgi:hypothetical protein